MESKVLTKSAFMQHASISYCPMTFHNVNVFQAMIQLAASVASLGEFRSHDQLGCLRSCAPPWAWDVQRSAWTKALRADGAHSYDGPQTLWARGILIPVEARPWESSQNGFVSFRNDPGTPRGAIHPPQNR